VLHKAALIALGVGFVLVLGLAWIDERRSRSEGPSHVKLRRGAALVVVFAALAATYFTFAPITVEGATCETPTPSTDSLDFSGMSADVEESPPGISREIMIGCIHRARIYVAADFALLLLSSLAYLSVRGRPPAPKPSDDRDAA
jgi:hypothetical protein